MWNECLLITNTYTPTHLLAQITQHIAANEQHVILPWIKTFPKKMMDRAPTYMYPITAAIMIQMGMAYALAGDHEEDVEHRF